MKLTQMPSHIEEANRYLKDARKMLTDNGKKEGKFYGDKKYVKMAGNTAWNGVVKALDNTLAMRKNLKKGQCPDVNDYQREIGKLNHSKLKLFNNAYDTLHRVLGYDGNLSVVIVREGLREAQEIIQWCETINK